MSLQINTNVKPYFDDFDEDKNYYRVMYKPGFPVQAREVTTTQSILQDQIEKLASRFLKNGDQVVPGEFTYEPNAKYVRCASITTGSEANDFVGYKLTGTVSGVVAVVDFAVDETDDDDTTFYVTYLDSGTDSKYSTFIEGETLESTHPNFYTATVGVTQVSKPITSPAMGVGIIFTIEDGAYFVDGFVVRNNYERIVVQKYGNDYTGYIGFLVTEEFITASEDTSLLDNAQGASNFAAPGADRLKVSLKLHTLSGTDLVPNFISLCQTIGGNLQGKPDKTVKWDWLYDILAQRTFNESGNYIVSDFVTKPLEYINSEDVEGLFDVDPETNNYPPIPGSGETEQITFDEADGTYVLDVSAGLAYVEGYEVGYDHSFYLYGSKPRTPELRPYSQTPVGVGNFFTITNVSGAPDIQCIEGDHKSIAFEPIILYRNFLDGYVGMSTVTFTTGSQEYIAPINRNRPPQVTYHVICNGPIGDTVETIIYKEGNTAVVIGYGDAIKRGDTLGGATVLQSIEIKPTPAGMMTPRYHIPNQVVADRDAGYEVFSSTYNLGVMSSQYFTEIAVQAHINPDVDWAVGYPVVGESSGATGIVEEGSRKDLLILSNINGDFVNGEEIDQNETEKTSIILRAGEVTKLEFYDAGTNNATIDLSTETAVDCYSLGNKKTLTVADGHLIATSSGIELTQLGRTELLDFPFSIDNTFSQSGSKVRIGLRTVPNGVLGYAVIAPAKITHSVAKTKSFYSELSDTNKFSADISTSNSADVESVTLADSKLFSGKQGDTFLTCDNALGDASEQLVAGDVISFSSTTGVKVKKLVYFVSKPAGNGTFEEPCTIFLTTALTEPVNGQIVTRQRIKTKGQVDENLLVPLPESTVKSLETNSEKTGIEYTFARQFYITVDSGADSFTIDSLKTNETFVTDQLVTVCVAKNLSQLNDPEGMTGRYLAIEDKIASDNGHKMTIHLFDTLDDNAVLKVIATCFVSNAQASRKVLQQKEIVIDTDAARNRIISLGEADGYKVISITNQTTGRDMLNDFIFDDGQRDNYYEIASLIRKDSTPTPGSPLVVEFQYFEHKNDGDFFSVDSYTHDEGVSYKDIPTYSQKVSDNLSNTPQAIELRDCIDFRPKVNTKEPFESHLAIPEDGVDAQSSKNFRDTNVSGNAFAPRIPTPGTQFQSDIEYYLPKVDSLFVLSSGEMIIVEGEQSSKPVAPPEIAEGIKLFDIPLPAFTFDATKLKLNRYNYRRYRMKDVHNLDERLTRLEEVFSLSLLENSALNMSVRDAVTGLDRYKNAFIVDAFRDHSRGNVKDAYYRCAIDPRSDHLRPPCYTDEVALEEINFTAKQRAVNGNYVNNNGLVTLPFTSTKFIEQGSASRSVNLQPYAVVTQQGIVTLSPPYDSYLDNTVVPSLVLQDNPLYDALEALDKVEYATGILGTVWGSWDAVMPKSQQSTNKGNTVNRNPNWFAQPVGSATTVFSERLSTSTMQRTVNPSATSVYSGGVMGTSFDDRVYEVELVGRMRRQLILVKAQGLKPNTEFHAFFDNINVSDWVAPDRTVQYHDGTLRYDMHPQPENCFFGKPLVSDDVGNWAGFFLIPNGRRPTEGTPATYDLHHIQHDYTGPTRSFATGSRIFRLTSNEVDANHNEVFSVDVDSFAEATYIAKPFISDKIKTAIATRFIEQLRTGQDSGPSLGAINPELLQPDYVPPGGGDDVRPLPINEDHGQGKLPVDAARSNRQPVCQTFLVDEKQPNGCFVTEVDVYFQTKDEVVPVEVYLITTDGGTPVAGANGKNGSMILPFSKVMKHSDTILHVQATLNQDSETFTPGTTFVGSKSGASATLKSEIVIFDRNENPTMNDSTHTYSFIFDNYLGEFEPGEEIVPDINPKSLSKFEIVQDEVIIDRVSLIKMGEGYDQETVEVVISEPDLRGGVNATAVARVVDGMVYEIVITDKGSGYTIPPSVQINGGSKAAEGIVRTHAGWPAVQMGVATSSDGTAATKFKFDAPVYLMGGNTIYGVCVYSPQSTKYGCWTAKLGENEFGTQNRVLDSDLSGALYKSSNGYQWTEDLTEKLKYTLYRADFVTSSTAFLKMQDAPLGMQQYQLNPIETSTNEIVGGVLDTVACSFVGTTDNEDNSLDDDSYTNVPLISTDPESTGKNGTIDFDVVGGLVVVDSVVVNEKGRGYKEGEILQVADHDAQFTAYVETAPSDVFGYNPRIAKVYHNFHGMVRGDYVQLIGVSGNPGGLDNSEFNTMNEVVDADLNSFTIRLHADATVTEKAGGGTVQGTYNRPYEVVDFKTGLMTFPTTSVVARERGAEAAGVTLYNEANAYERTAPNVIKLEQTYYHSTPKLVANRLNEIKYHDSFHLRNEKSLELSIELSSRDRLLSPVIDVDRTNAVVVRNLVDKPDPDRDIYGANAMSFSFNADIPTASVEGKNTIHLLKDGKERAFRLDSYNVATRKLRLSGNFEGITLDAAAFADPALAALGLRQASDTKPTNFHPETQNNGSAYAKWISKAFLFENPCDGIKIQLAALMSHVSDIRVFYRLKLIGSETEFDNLTWVAFNPDQTESDPKLNAAGEAIATPGMCDQATIVKLRSSNTTNPYDIAPGEYKTYSWTAQDLAKFDGIQVKIVMTAENPALAPLIDDMQLVCSE